MVYINTFNAIFGVFLIILLSAFIIFVAFLWIDNLQGQVDESINEVSFECSCLDVISDTGNSLIIMNTNCLYVVNLTINGTPINDSIYYEDFIVYSYTTETLFTFVYNTDCFEYYSNE